VSATARTVSAQNETEKPSAQQFEAWISDMASEDYSQRQLATILFTRHKAQAIPFAILALENASGEKADRLFQFLSSIAADPYSPDGDNAYNAIEKVAAARTTSKAMRAQKILEVIGDEQKELSLDRLERLQVELRDRYFQIISTRVYVRNALVIDATFPGTASDLECLKWLTEIEFVKLEGPKINRDVLRHVAKMRGLKRLQLVQTELRAEDLEALTDAPDLDLLEIIYSSIGDEAVDVLSRVPVLGDLYLFGTNLTQHGQQELKSRIDGVDFVFARGGFLGVQCQATSVIIDVVTGAAEIAGLRRNDRIRRINNIPVVVFEDLRRELAKFAVGEQVVIEFERVSYPFESPDKLELPDDTKLPADELERLRGRLQRREKRETLTLPVTLGKRQEIPRDR